MADSILANILAYIWSLFFACFDGQSRSELPLVAPQGNSRAEALASSNSYKIGWEFSSLFFEQHELTLEEGHYEKEQFLRHPSIGSKRKGRQKEAISETHSRQRSSNFSLGSSMQYLSSFVRHPRAGSATVPVVIVTPSSPTKAVAELPPASSLSTLELTDATVESSLLLTPSTSVFEDTGEVSVKQVSIPPDVESDISVIEFDSWTTSAPREAAASEPSFFLSESLQKITFTPIRCASHALSAVSDLYDVPAAQTSGVGIMPSYFTSTPPKRNRSTGTKLGDIENNHAEPIAPLELPSHDVFYQYVDHLIPYPDVFDLDMYYDTSVPFGKNLKKLYSRDGTFDNSFSLYSGDLIDPLLSESSEKLPLDDFKEKYGMATSSVTVISSLVEHKHDFGSCREIISQFPSTHSLLKTNSSPSKSQEQQHRISLHNSVNHRYIKPLNELTNMPFKTSGTTPNSNVYSIDKSPSTRVKNSHRQIHSLPASAHIQRSRSNYCPQRSRTSSDSESDAGSMDALRARLREACDISTSFSTHTEEMEIWEPVSF